MKRLALRIAELALRVVPKLLRVANADVEATDIEARRRRVRQLIEKAKVGKL